MLKPPEKRAIEVAITERPRQPELSTHDGQRHQFGVDALYPSLHRGYDVSLDDR